MRSVRKLRWGGLAAAVGTAALVTPLLAVQPAQAAGDALTITKEVGTIASSAVPFDPSLEVIGATGHQEWTAAGLRVWTEGWTSEDKVAQFVPTDTPLSDVGEPKVHSTANSGTIPPGFWLKVDFNNNGTVDGILIGEPTYYGNHWWLTSTSQQWVKDRAPSTGGGHGSNWHGTLDQWRSEFSTANVLEWGFSLGSGVLGDHTVTGLTFANEFYSLARTYQPSLEAAPGETVEYKLTIKNTSAATVHNIEIRDALPADLTYVENSLRYQFGPWCSVTGQNLKCGPTGGSLSPGESAWITFQAKVNGSLSTAGQPTTTGHWVDVQKQENFANLPAGTITTHSVSCPSGFIATDGGLLVDSVDQGGYYTDVATLRSKPTADKRGWTVKVANLGEFRATGKAKVTCLTETLGNSNGHTHKIVVGDAQAPDITTNPGGTVSTVVGTCPAGYTPIAPSYEITNGLAVIQKSHANGSTWTWTVNHEDTANLTFGLQCLAPRSADHHGHSAALVLSHKAGTVTVGTETRTDETLQCADGGNGIVGGYRSNNEALLSLGTESRGNNYMFRFYNDDWEHAHHADIAVTCVGVRTADEAPYILIRNTAKVGVGNTMHDSSSADLVVSGDADGGSSPASGVTVKDKGHLKFKASGKTKSVGLWVNCAEQCIFQIRVVKDGTVVAKASKSIAAGGKTIQVPTTSAGKDLGYGDVTVKIKMNGSSTVTSHPVLLRP